MRNALIVLLLLCGGCEFGCGCDMRTRAHNPPAPSCAEFIHGTTREDVATQCQMVWCGGESGGPATLWCDLVPAEKTP